MAAAKGYWVYENWKAEHKAVVHEGTCGSCKQGQGCHPNPLGNKNGRWHGPFATLAIANTKAAATKRPVRKHSCA
jgi:hypothetical protein